MCCFHLLSLLSVSLLSDEGSSLSAPHLKRWRTSRRTLPSAGRTLSRAAAGVARLTSDPPLDPTHTAAAFVPRFRCRTLSGSPRPKSFKKIHFIKNMRQHDVRNGRYEARRRRLLASRSRPVNGTAVWRFLTLPATSDGAQLGPLTLSSVLILN